ncbi:MAG: SURF1 family protein, partial [Demequinaceae bacterium]|nr:SURF1 family protein [Demequinaceae bacterium]
MTATPDRDARPTARPAAYSPGRIALTVVIVLALMAVGLVAGKWQWGRYETRANALRAQDKASGLDTVPLESILSPDALGPGNADWRTVTVAGAIEAGGLVELRGRSVDGTATIQYLAWLHTEQGNAVLINLGWTPRSEPSLPVIPDGAITVTGTVRSFESDNGRPGTRITPAQMGLVDGQVLQAYVMVDSACADAGCVTGLKPVPLPALSTGPHLSYAMQWWLLLVAAAPVGVWLTVRDARLERERLAVTRAASPENGK